MLLAVGVGLGLVLYAHRRRKRRLGGLDSAVSFSSRLVAAARAAESEREDALFVDPFAAVFAGEEALRRVAARGGKLDGRIAVRTKFFDDALLAALGRTPGAQVVLLGAGLDSRAWRLSPPDGGPKCSRLVEVDRADVLGCKGQLLSDLPGGLPRLTLSACYIAVACDLTRAWDCVKHITNGGHTATEPTVWLLEGLLYYLPQWSVDALLRALSIVSAPGSTLVASCVNTAGMMRAQNNSKSEAMRSFQSAVDDPAVYFSQRGWRVIQAVRPGDPECSFGGRHAAPEHPATETSKPATFYVVAIRAEQ